VLGYGCVSWVIWDQNSVGCLEEALLGASEVGRKVGIEGVGKRQGHGAGESRQVEGGPGGGGEGERGGG